MKLYSKIVRAAVLPLADSIAGTSISKNLGLLEKSQWWSLKELQKYQNKRLSELIRHVYSNVPYYHKKFRELGLKPQDIRSVNDLQKLPIITKDDIQRNFNDFKSIDFDKRGSKPASTGGSTGDPLRYFINWDTWSMSWATQYRGWGYAGYRVGDKIVTLGGSSLVPDEEELFKKKIKNKLIERRLLLSAFDMSKENMGQYIHEIANHEPLFLRGYPSAIHVFAKFIKDYDAKFPSIQGIFTVAETLFDTHRSEIEDIFGVDVFNGYGCRDGGANAMECPEHTGLHYSMEPSIIEFINDGENVIGERGELILTDLCNYSFPFIRYKVGDEGILSDEKCPCGRGLPIIKEVLGSVEGLVVTPRGMFIHGEFFIYIIRKKIDGVKQFQVIQEKLDKLIIKIIPNSEFKNESIQKIRQIVELRMGEDVDIEIKLVDAIPATKSGKRQFIVSKL